MSAYIYVLLFACCHYAAFHNVTIFAQGFVGGRPCTAPNFQTFKVGQARGLVPTKTLYQAVPLGSPNVTVFAKI